LTPTFCFAPEIEKKNVFSLVESDFFRYQNMNWPKNGNTVVGKSRNDGLRAFGQQSGK